MCIDDKWPPRMGGLRFLTPKEGEYYTVREDGHCAETGHAGVSLMEGHQFWGYPREHFRRMESEHSESGSVRREEPVGV